MTALLESEPGRALLTDAPRSLVLDAIRATLDDARRGGPRFDAAGEWLAQAASRVLDMQRLSLRPVLNATGVVLHTNLGRAPLATAAIDAMVRVASGYSNLEYDIDAGTRGSRYVHAVSLLRELTGAEDALVVNNNAGALVLALDTLARGRDAIVSRGELVEIGGSFRVPEIMEKGGARLVEVGTTNRTHLADYQRAISADTGAIVRVHRSNFALEGYVAEASAGELASLCDERGVPLIHDLGSGLMISLASLGLTGEPTAREAASHGGTLVTMSGDKLLGGPQCGIMLGTHAVIERLRENPLARAFRVDKLTLAALEATLALYREPPRALAEIPTLAMLGATVDSLRVRGEALLQQLGAITGVGISLDESTASVGGGAFPVAKIPSLAIALACESATKAERALRAGTPAVIGRVDGGRVLLDLRTIPSRDDELLRGAILAAFAS
ncbi:MAG: L-seryl-tRNA(Sec) selenium transferase [Gemmatimonadetes bacterium]|nr:L-seryl-tRNA(Sec) selenium transferase [Gemmatimonadota bacterium]